MERKKQLKTLFRIKSRLTCSWDDLMRLSVEQVSYISRGLSVGSFLEACPGSGKTEVVGIKAAFSIANWKSKGSGMAVVTFTTSAAKELNNRIRKYGAISTETFPHYVGTFDSWIHGYLVQPFAHNLTHFQGREGDKSLSLVDVDNTAAFLKHYQSSISVDGRSIPVPVTEFSLDHSQKPFGLTDPCKGLIQRATVDELKALRDNKANFIKAGFATYSDFEFLAFRLLTKYPELAKRIAARFPVLIVDECQDLSTTQLSILNALQQAGTVLHFVGDLNQSIYEFRSVDPNEIIKFINCHLTTKLRLTNNYRSCQDIVDICQNLIRNPSLIIGIEPGRVEKSCLLWEYDDESFAKLPKRFEDHLKGQGIPIAKSAILARGKSTLSPLRTQEEKNSLKKVELFALAIYNWYRKERQTEDMKNALFYMGRALCLSAYQGRGDSKNQYCPREFEPVSWRQFLVSFLEAAKSLHSFCDDSNPENWKDWAASLRVHLKDAWAELPENTPGWDKVARSFLAPSGRGDEPVIKICSSPRSVNKIRTTTIHSVKGETLDAVLLISHVNKKSSGGHFSHWINKHVNEHVRFAYVACSRPKFLLIIATPRLSKADLKNFASINLKPI
jgi:DNA helicase-2/ATP-dependent DNA helicase PcrA